jgi:hypothetical protein
MTNIDHTLNTLAHAGIQCTLAQLHRLTKISKPALSEALERLLERGDISVKRNGVKGRYYLTLDQFERWVPKAPKTWVLSPQADAVALARRLRFLNELSTRPAFQGHALLSEIVDDYRKALRQATLSEGES